MLYGGNAGVGKQSTHEEDYCEAIMSLGKPEQVRREVKRRVADFAPGGGFVFASIHNIQSEVPPENVVAFFDAALEFGKY